LTARLERHAAIMRLVAERHLSTQAELADALRESGIETAQATISRDVGQLGLVKVRNGDGRLIYAPPGAADLRRRDQLTTALRSWATGMTPTGPLLVLSTLRGFAAALADAIDDAALPEVAGTIAGDNTVFVAMCEGHAGAELAEQLSFQLDHNGRNGDS
jgi:transcriptional regulator of arginine metabolism